MVNSMRLSDEYLKKQRKMVRPSNNNTQSDVLCILPAVGILVADLRVPEEAAQGGGCASYAGQQLLWGRSECAQRRLEGSAARPGVSASCFHLLITTAADPAAAPPATGPQHDWPVGLRGRHKQAPSSRSEAARLFVFQLSFPLHRSRFDLPIGSVPCCSCCYQKIALLHCSFQLPAFRRCSSCEHTSALARASAAFSRHRAGTNGVARREQGPAEVAAVTAMLTLVCDDMLRSMLHLLHSGACWHW